MTATFRMFIAIFLNMILKSMYFLIGNSVIENSAATLGAQASS